MLTMPVLGIGGSGYELLASSLPSLTTNLKLRKLEDSGHFILEEQPNLVAELIVEFIKKSG